MRSGAHSQRVGGLDLLRALAVVAVLLYHADDLLSGGLLGVTVFFTLSGFLITGQLWAQLETSGRVELGQFWSRRVRRLVPASVLTLVAIAVVWPLVGYELGSSEIVSSLLPLRNWVMLGAHAGYGSSPSPTSHFWSLAVEEQVYLALPLVVWGLFRWKRPRLAIVALATGATASLAWGAALASSGRLERAYLGTDARFGEVVMGAALAIWLARAAARGRPPGRFAVAAAWVALGGLGMLFVGVSWPSRAVSTWAIPATVVASMLVCRGAMVEGTALGRWGASRPVRVVADHAYELYLVHVPVYRLISTYRTGLTGPPLLAARLGVSLVLALALHQLVEPVRRRRWLASPGWLVGALVPTMLAVGAVVLVRDTPDIVSTAGAAVSDLPPQLLAQPRSTSAPPVADAAAPPTGDEVASRTSVESTTTTTTTAVVAPGANSIWLLGDSTLRELNDPELTEPPLSQRLGEHGWRVTGVVGILALATCDERPFGGTSDDPAITLPAVRDVIAAWAATSPARTVLVQLGANDILQLRLTDDELAACVAATIDALPSGTTVDWVLPSIGPWCWCDDVDRAHVGVAQFAGVLERLTADRPWFHLFLDGLTDDSVDPRAMILEDGIHASAEGRSIRVAALVRQLGEPPTESAGG